MWLVIGAIAVIGLAAYGYWTNRGRGGNGAAGFPDEAPPPALGLQPDHPAYDAALRLEASLDPDFVERLHQRVRERHPLMTESEWQWTWFELKRYFLLCGVMRQVQMYSRRADDIWHEMLVFTREYQQFCERFCGTMIHHVPHGKAEVPNADDRAWFDWAYTELFTLSPVSGRIWGSFFRAQLSRSALYEPVIKSRHAYMEGRFNMRAAERFGDLAGTAEWLAKRFVDQLDEARRLRERGERYPRRSEWASGSTACWGGALLYASLGEPHEFERQMDAVLAPDARRDGASDGGVYGGHDGRHDGHADGGSDGGSGGDGGSAGCGGGGCGSS